MEADTMLVGMHAALGLATCLFACAGRGTSAWACAGAAACPLAVLATANGMAVAALGCALVFAATWGFLVGWSARLGEDEPMPPAACASAPCLVLAAQGLYLRGAEPLPEILGAAGFALLMVARPFAGKRSRDAGMARVAVLCAGISLALLVASAAVGSWRGYGYIDMLGVTLNAGVVSIAPLGAALAWALGAPAEQFAARGEDVARNAVLGCVAASALVLWFLDDTSSLLMVACAAAAAYLAGHRGSRGTWARVLVASVAVCACLVMANPRLLEWRQLAAEDPYGMGYVARMCQEIAEAAPLVGNGLLPSMLGLLPGAASDVVFGEVLLAFGWTGAAVSAACVESAAGCALIQGRRLGSWRRGFSAVGAALLGVSGAAHVLGFAGVIPLFSSPLPFVSRGVSVGMEALGALALVVLALLPREDADTAVVHALPACGGSTPERCESAACAAGRVSAPDSAPARMQLTDEQDGVPK